METHRLEFRHRPRLDQTITEKHAAFKSALSQFKPPWGYAGITIPDADDLKNGDDLSSTVTLSEMHHESRRSEIEYLLRSEKYLCDDSEFDDNFVIEIRNEDLDINFLVESVLPVYIPAFDCYRFGLLNEQQRLDDWKSISAIWENTGSDADGRNGVYRIPQVCYFDRELCKRAFSLTPEKIASQLSGKIYSARLIYEGVLLVHGLNLLSRSELLDFDKRVKRLLLPLHKRLFK